MLKGIIQSPRGTKDILFEEQKYWFFLFDIVREKLGTFGAKRIETPIFEFAEIYSRAIGRGTDIVDKEMFEVRRASSSFDIKSGVDDNKIMVLRPEYTAGIVRAYIQNGMSTYSQPVKLWYWGPCFRYERPQAGRFRIHNQFGLEVLGDDSPLTDAAVILSSWQILKKLNLEKSLIVDINSIGDNECRPKMKKKLTEYFQDFLPNLCPDCNGRFVENPLRILDCKEEKCQKIIAGAPQLIDLLCDECKTHFKSVLESLDTLEIPYNLNSRLVRGLDYYTRTVFEIYISNDKNRQRTLIGGGRYDDLIKLMGGEKTPAVGYAAGIERIIEVLNEKQIEVNNTEAADISIVQIGDKARKMALSILSTLENEGFKTNLIIGQREVIDKSVIFKDMDNGSQETITQKKLVEDLKKKFNLK